MKTILLAALVSIASISAMASKGTLVVKFNYILYQADELTKAGKFFLQAADEKTKKYLIQRIIGQNGETLDVTIAGTTTRAGTPNNASVTLAVLTRGGPYEITTLSEASGKAVERLLKADGIDIRAGRVLADARNPRNETLYSSIPMDGLDEAGVAKAFQAINQVGDALETGGLDGVRALGRVAERVEPEFQWSKKGAEAGTTTRRSRSRSN